MSQNHTDEINFKAILKIDIEQIQRCPIAGQGHQWHGAEGWNISLEEAIEKYKLHVSTLHSDANSSAEMQPEWSGAE